MDKSLFPIRLVFVALCASAGWLVTIPITEWDRYRGVAFTVGLCIGLLVVLVDVMLKGFSLRGMTALTFNNIVVVPIRSGVGLRLGANIGYLKFTNRPTWNPF